MSDNHLPNEKHSLTVKGIRELIQTQTAKYWEQHSDYTDRWIDADNPSDEKSLYLYQKFVKVRHMP
jgi:hypothetical protein